MFDRKVIKEQAKALMKRSYWMLVLVVFLAGLLGGAAGGGFGVNLNMGSGLDDTDTSFSDVPWGDAESYGSSGNIWEGPLPGGGSSGQTQRWELEPVWDVVLSVLAAVIVGAALLGVLFQIFVGNIVAVGLGGWLMRYWRGDTPAVGDLFAAFRTYRAALGATALQTVLTFLWSLLFIVPGIVKGLAYSMTPYIIYENPHLSAAQALQVSERMTDGAKGELFVLSLSFIGWNFLSALTGGILGALYVNPYRGVTYAGVYDQLKWNAIQTGRLTWSDFGQMPPEWSTPYTPPMNF